MEEREIYYQSRGQIIAMSTPHVMGILNVTPDSFYDGGKHVDPEAIKAKIATMIDEGANSIDIGGMSTRPGGSKVSVEEEWSRVEQPLKAAIDLGAIVSIDTMKAEIARRALDLGVHLVNDISAGTSDDQMYEIVAHYNCIYIAMHMQGNPQTMQLNPQYQSVTLDVLNYFARRLNVMRQSGVNQVVLDPGFGFGKSLQHNYELFNGLSSFGIFDCPIMLGVSRKSMIYTLNDGTPDEALPGSLGLALLGLESGARMLRVHDVKETVQIVKVFNQLKSNLS